LDKPTTPPGSPPVVVTGTLALCRALQLPKLLKLVQLATTA
jgi:hypothetical protein